MKKVLLSTLPIVLVTILLAACDRQEPAIPVTPPVKPLDITLNEVYSRGDATNPDWIEIFNPNTTPIDISGYRIYDSGGQSGTKPKKQIPAGTTIPAMGFFVITVDTADASGFGLSSGGETVWFENATGTIIDSAAIPALGADTSFGRKPDGTGAWQKLSPPTKGLSNTSGGDPVVPVVLNETYSRGIATDPDWVEIYNPNAVSITLTGYKLYDTGGNSGTKPKLEIPAGSVVPAHGWFVVVVDVTTEPWGFGLSSGGDEVWLENAGGVVIDHVVIPAMEITQSYGRFPDGGATWKLLNTITKGAANKE